MSEVSEVVAYHPKTCELALLRSYGDYWIGSLMSAPMHQNGEPPFGFVFGYYKTFEEGMARLNECSGEEF